MQLKKYCYSITLGLLTFCSAAWAQTYPATLPKTAKAPTLLLSQNNIVASALDSIIAIEIATNVDFTIEPAADWLQVLKVKENCIYFKPTVNNTNADRTTTAVIQQANGTKSITFSIIQQKLDPLSTLRGDYKIVPTSGAAPAQGGAGIEKTFDGDMSTMYHSPWENSSPTYFPITMQYNFTNALVIDYLIYYPRLDGSNGLFKTIDVFYQLEGQNTFTKYKSLDLGGSSIPTRIEFETPLIKPTAIQIVVKSGVGDGQGFASCAEMEFYKSNEGIGALISELFADKACTELKAGITDEEVNNCPNIFLRELARKLKDESYGKEFRIAEFSPYATLTEIKTAQRTAGYDPYENPTGIRFTQGKSYAIIVDNPDNEPVAVRVYNRWIEDVDGGGNSARTKNSTYFLKNGINKITPTNDGNVYLSYYTTNWRTAKKVKVHFVDCPVNGYYDLEKFKNTEKDGYDLLNARAEWRRILQMHRSFDPKGWIDIISERHHSLFPSSAFESIPSLRTDATPWIITFDSIVYYQHELMGLLHYNREYPNRQFTQMVGSKDGIFMNDTGSHLPVSYVSTLSNLDFWGPAHETGHTNQLRPTMSWVGMGEVSNNIYSAYIELKVRNSAWARKNGASYYHRLEVEGMGSNNDYTNFANGFGGRVNRFLNWGVRDGKKHQFQSKDGAQADVFVTLVPFWQMILYFKEAGFAPNYWSYIYENARNMDMKGKTHGDFQLAFMRTACDSTKQNLIPYFDQIGFLREYNDQIGDYSSEMMTITKAQIDELKAHVASKNYPLPASPVICYINAHSYKIYRDRLPLTKGAGAPVVSNGFITVNHNLVCPNAVAFEYYESDAVKPAQIIARGWGYSAENPMSTRVPFSATSGTRVDAVGWDGTRETIYSK